MNWSEVWDGFEAQACAVLGPGAKWERVPVVPELTNGQFRVPVPPDSGRYFRLHKP